MRAYAFSWLALVVLAACSPKVVAPTQVTVRISASLEVQAASELLRIRVAAPQGTRWLETGKKEVTLAGLHWPYDLTVLPDAGTSSHGKFEVIVETLGKLGKQDRAVLVEARIITNFVPGHQKLLEIPLERCGDKSFGMLCAAESCLGPTDCSTCSASTGTCASVPTVAGESLHELDPDADAKPNPANHPPLDLFDGGAPDAQLDGAPNGVLDGGGDAGRAFDAGFDDHQPEHVDPGSCASIPGEPNIGFGTHKTQYVSSAILPSHLYRSERDALVEKVYDQWKTAYLRADDCPGKSGYYALANDADADDVRTSSDRHGSAMVIVALMAGYDANSQSLFDALYRYYLDHPANAAPLMARTQDKSCGDKYAGSASDGDLDIAYALLLANKQWGSSGDVDYRSAASRLIAAIRQNDVQAAGGYMLLGGGADEDAAHRDATRISDFMPGHLASFYGAEEPGTWYDLMSRSYELIARLQHQYAESTGLVPDFAQGLSAGDPRPADADFFSGSADGAYSVHACRMPLRVALHYLTSGNRTAQSTVERINAWIEHSTKGDPLQIKAGYKLDGTPLDASATSMAFVAPLGVAAMASQRQDWLNALWDAASDEQRRDGRYLGDTLELLSLIAMSGNFWAPESVYCKPVASPPPDAGPEADAGHDAGQPIEICHNETLAPVSVPPCKRMPNQVPLFVSFGFTNTGDLEGLKWAIDLAQSKDVSFTFFAQCKALKSSPELLALFQQAQSQGNEVANYALSTPADGRTLDLAGWAKLIDDCDTFLGSNNLWVTGFRAPGLRYDDAMFKALEGHNGHYDSSLREGFGEDFDGSNDYFPYTLDFASPGHAAQLAQDPSLGELGLHPGLWELPLYNLLPPPALRRPLHERQASYRTRLAASDASWWPAKAKGGFELSGPELVQTLEYSFDRRMQGNHAPLLLDLDTLYYALATSTPGATPSERRAAIAEFIDYVLGQGGQVDTFENVRRYMFFPTTH
jgi:endo-1,4-beta-D-glucanase Y